MFRNLKYVAKKLTGRMPPMLGVSTAAPAFEVKDHEGRTVSSQGLLGRRYVLWFYPKADTPG